MRLRPVFIALAACALLARCAAPSAAGAPLAPLLPLDLGNHWEYVGIGGTPDQEAITGTQVILGRTVAVKSYFAGPDAGLKNWWLTGPGGEVLLAGFDRASDSFSLGYEPPITFCGGSPALGDSWTTHVVAYELPSMALYGEFDITFGVLEDVQLSVPAGTFPSFGVGQIVQPGATAFAPARGFTVDGRLAPGALRPATNIATDWYSRGVGVVQFLTNDVYRLTGYGNATAARATTWGRLKQLYR